MTPTGLESNEQSPGIGALLQQLYADPYAFEALLKVLRDQRVITFAM